MELSTDVTDEQFLSLENNSSIRVLNFNNNKNIKDATIQRVLPTLTNLQVLYVSGTNMSSLNWCKSVSNKSNLREIDITNTTVEYITPLKGFTNLGIIRANGSYLKLYSDSDESIEKDTTEILNIVSRNSTHGFKAISSSLVEQLGKLEGLESISLYWGDSVNATLDLRNTKVTHAYRVYNGPTAIYFPDTLEYLDVHVGGNVLLNSDKNLKKIIVSWSTNNVNVIKQEAVGSIDFVLSLAGLGRISKYSSVLNKGIKSLTFSTTNYINDYKKSNLFNTSELKNCTNMESAVFENVTCDGFDGLDFSETLTTLKIINCNISNFKNMSEIKNLNNLVLQGLNIASLEFLVNKSSSSPITTLNLSNNLLQNHFTYTNEEGKNITLNTSEFLSTFPNLKSINLSGNKDLTDFTALENAGFVNDGNNNFTKN